MTSPVPESGVSADEYCRLARLRITGRTLQNYCKRNPFLADRIGELRLPGLTQYDPKTASRFREHYAAAEKELRNAANSAHRLKTREQ